MAKPGWLVPALAGAATLATAGAAAPALVGAEGAALGAGEAGLLGAGEAAGGLGAAEAATGLGAAAGEAAAPALADAGAFFIPGTSEALTGTGLTSFASPLAEAGSSVSGALPSVGTIAGEASPLTSDFTGGAVGAGNAFGLPTGSVVGGETLLSGASPSIAEAGTAAVDTGAPATNLSISNLAGLSGDAGFEGSSNLNALAGQTGEAGFATGGSTGDWWDKVSGWFDRNQGWLKPAVAGAGLATSIGRDTGTIPGSGPVTDAAKAATTQGAFLTGQANQNLGALNTGALPAGAQSTIDAATRNAKASVRSQYAAMGMHTPAAALAAVDEQAGALKLAEADKLTALGVKEAGLAGGQQDLASYDYNLLMKESIQQNKDLADSIARFAAALA